MRFTLRLYGENDRASRQAVTVYLHARDAAAAREEARERCVRLAQQRAARAYGVFDADGQLIDYRQTTELA
jgi:hypothetical protein